MSIPSGDKVLGESGHLKDHNDITDVLRDHESRIDSIEGTPALPSQGVGSNMKYLRSVDGEAEWDAVDIEDVVDLQDTIDDLQSGLNAKADIDSPEFTGTPTAPTPTNGDNTTKVATTAFVLANGGGNVPVLGTTVSIAEVRGGTSMTTDEDDDYLYWAFDESSVIAVTIDDDEPTHYVDLEVYCWGGGGGGDGGSITPNHGGGGGFGWAKWRVHGSRIMSVCVGGGGSSRAGNTGPGPRVEGGGGRAGAAGYGGQGGGLTGLFDQYPWDTAGIPVVIAGGGGGAGVVGSTDSCRGGGGGGDTAQNGLPTTGAGTGGTQTGPGVNAGTGGYGSAGLTLALEPGRYQGGESYANPDSGGAGGGGGGYYGGGSGDNEPHNSGGGGGSGFLSPLALDGELIAATDHNPANDDDTLYTTYLSGKGVGGYTTTPGTGGGIVIRWAKAA